MGNSTRLPQVARGQEMNPGPANYTISLLNKASAPKFGFGSSQREAMGGKESGSFPGPGQYVAQSMMSGSKSSIHAKLEYKTIQNTAGDTPGPSAYELTLKNKHSYPAYKLGTEKRDTSSGKHVGPASNTYLPSMSFTSKAAAKWGFGSETRQAMGKSGQSPGPDSYALKSMSFDSEKPRFHVGMRLSPSKETTVVPGPGNYNPDMSKVQKSMPKFSMKVKLGSSLGNDNFGPAPGQYDSHLNNRTSAPKFGFGSSKRTAMGKND